MKENIEKKIDRCKFSHTSFRRKDDGSYPVHCFNKLSGDHYEETTEAACETCEAFKSRYIEYPLTINGIESKKLDYKGFFHQQGTLVKVRPCGEEYGKKTYLGFYLGDLPLAITHSFNEKSGILNASTLDNPAIFVPELGKIIWGYASWWREIENENDIKEITDDDISHVWYVRLVRELQEREDGKGGDP